MIDKMYLYGLMVWFLFVILAIINGLARNNLYQERLGELLAHQVSSVIFITIIFTVTYLFIHFGKFGSTPTEYLFLGLMWTSLTIVFEFGFGHYVAGHSWDKLLTDYNIFSGRLWTLVLASSALAPVIIDKILH